MNRPTSQDDPFGVLVHSIVRADIATATKMIADLPVLARQRVGAGVVGRSPADRFFDEILHYMYEGDSALHMAAAAYQTEIANDLVANGADVRAKNRRGAEPLHYAGDGVPGSRYWNPAAQAATIASLINAGADPNAVDKSGVTPLHRAIRTRCAAAVEALVNGGADVLVKNRSGSTPSSLTSQNTGRSGSGSPEARDQQQQILRFLRQHGAS